MRSLSIWIERVLKIYVFYIVGTAYFVISQMRIGQNEPPLTK